MTEENAKFPLRLVKIKMWVFFPPKFMNLFIPPCGPKLKTSALKRLDGVSEGTWTIGELKELRISVTKAVANT